MQLETCIFGLHFGDLISIIAIRVCAVFYMCPTIATSIVQIQRSIISVQVTANELRSQITSLQAALEVAREEIAARSEHEAKLTSQFQVGPLWVVVLL